MRICEETLEHVALHVCMSLSNFEFPFSILQLIFGFSRGSGEAVGAAGLVVFAVSFRRACVALCTSKKLSNKDLCCCALGEQLGFVFGF